MISLPAYFHDFPSKCSGSPASRGLTTHSQHPLTQSHTQSLLLLPIISPNWNLERLWPGSMVWGSWDPGEPLIQVTQLPCPSCNYCFTTIVLGLDRTPSQNWNSVKPDVVGVRIYNPLKRPHTPTRLAYPDATLSFLFSNKKKPKKKTNCTKPPYPH